MHFRSMTLAVAAGLLTGLAAPPLIPDAEAFCRFGGGERRAAMEDRFQALRERVWSRHPLRDGHWSGDGPGVRLDPPATRYTPPDRGGWARPAPPVGGPGQGGGWSTPAPPAWPAPPPFPRAGTWYRQPPEPPQPPANPPAPPEPPGRASGDNGQSGGPAGAGPRQLPYANPLPDPWSGSF